jgi:uncharacterized protein YegL
MSQPTPSSPIRNPSLDNHAIQGSHYGFSATRIDDLGAAEYTLVAIAADASGSVHGFRKAIERSIAEVARACRRSPRADNLMLRVTRFDHDVHEIHGFVPLPNCDPKGYAGCLEIGGTTALFDAAYNAIGSVVSYGQNLVDNDFEVNGIVFVITDGFDNASSTTADRLKKGFEAVIQQEALESLLTILVGVGVDPQTSKQLAQVQKDAGFDRYIELTKANASTLAKLADFVSRSIGAQSKALGSGRASASLSF